MNELTQCILQPLREDGEFAIARAQRPDGLPSRLLVSPVREQPLPASIGRLEQAFALRGELDPAWAARPVELTQFRGQHALVLEDPGGQFLDEVISGPLAAPDFLRLAI